MSLPLKELLGGVPLFEGVSYAELEPQLKKCGVEDIKPGKYIGREGEYNEHCSVLLDGRAKVVIHKETVKKEITLEKGEIFGEIAAISGNPRTADIVAENHCTVLNIPRRDLFRIFDKFSVIKERVDALYRQRALSAHLNSIPLFAGTPPDVMKELQEKITLHSLKKGEVVFKQGDDADAFYLVRYGFVKVFSGDGRGSEKVLAYLKEGHYFGEMALIKEGVKRTATVQTTNRTELIKISRDDFQKLLEIHPNLKRNLEYIIKKREDRNVQLGRDTFLASTLSSSMESGIIQTKAILIIDTTKCVRCDNCVKACAALHNGKSRLVRRGTKFNNFILVPTSCRHCEDPTCMSKCPTGAICRDANGEVYHKDFCIGCGSCAKNCPYGNITIAVVSEDGEKETFFTKVASLFRGRNGKETSADAPARFVFPGDRDLVQREASERLPGDRDMTGEPPAKTGKKAKPRRKATKCDMCREYPFMGCVYNCPRGAARRVDPTEFFAELTTIG